MTELTGTGSVREQAVADLHALLLRVARREAFRRRAALGIDGPELDDLAHQAAADAMVAIIAKVREFRGESRFTTWAYKFVLLELANKIGRHFWRRRTWPMEQEDWDRLPDRFGLRPEDQAEWRDLVAALRRAVDDELTEHQRTIFSALVLGGVPADALADKLGTTRNALYKALFDARRKLRANLVANGYLTLGEVERS
ncbi:sigma-70 family RNA polymerase sigma factor [Actinomadura madurae]|uniref:sigma-70 family RNA polymerase sigma factor n=1 Tax=Actinomadura madurae TaxID=1993 RepID=UPI0020D21FBE|nr:sigma-70 family RNA polymerase sigma factor [Actinomadura madurae]MCP9950017.1 sigma-70 family RNA polymerase sigma factor [Actinomadura madurae]MCP9966776.1 sigma-70 family RNA polymerase sigma factor [Actinomadura madurae]MCP9979265.1 sigma-70 family RNA polymerase sigma factor [Actinomadura madurae]MCQ0009209.1 sigma-70 family RNA polymerase sigma factor [Actinomadura madurae]MCQ0015458.1 sigma-70 family RNA polymerase sigma factor [Actinomadura madurae]